jgi:hypothetical protein
VGALLCFWQEGLLLIRVFVVVASVAFGCAGRGEPEPWPFAHDWLVCERSDFGWVV